MPACNKIEILKEKLEDLYLNKNLSIAEIANKLGSSTGSVHRSLREYKIPIRNLSEACTKVPVTKKQLKEWYFKDKFSMFEIADRLGCTHSAIVYKFQKLGIKSRGHLGLTKPVKLTKKGFEYLYYEKRLSLKKIAKIVHRSESGLERRFKDYNLKSRGTKNRACKYKKKDFSGNLVEKAYMIGFRLGDLNVYNLKNIIQVRCSSTVNQQISLIRKLFSSYTVPKTRKYLDKKYKIIKTDIICLLNKSFSFLTPKEDKIPSWILKDKTSFFSFFAGYTDAEGCFYFKKPGKLGKTKIASFEIQTQQKNIIWQLWKNMQKYKIEAPSPKISVRAGYRCPDGNRNNKDMWRFDVCKKNSLWRLVNFLEPYMKHANKLKRIREVKNNLILRNEILYGHPMDLSIPILL